MISALRHGPVGRTFEEDDEEEQAIQFTDPAHSLDLHIAPDSLRLTSPSCVFFCLDIAAKPFANALISSCDMKSVGYVKFREGKTQVAHLFHSESVNAFVVVVINKIEDHMASAFAGLFDSFNARSMVIADSLSMSSYVGSGNESSLRKLVSLNVSTHSVMSVSTAISGTPSLEIGNIVIGLSAALLSHAEARQVPASVFLVLSKVFLSVPSMKAFEALAPLFQALLGDVAITLPANAVYNEQLKRDPYLLRTENLYS